MSNTCRMKVGLLVLRTCGEEAVDTCSTCGRPICPKHRIKQSGLVQCLDCALDGPMESESPRLWQAYERRVRYRAARYHPLYLSDSGYYGEDDYRVFDERGEAEEAGASDLEDDMDFNSSDDYLES